MLYCTRDIKTYIDCNLKIVVQMSEWSQMIELENLSNLSKTPNLATLNRLACTGSYSSINCGDRQLFRQQFAIY